jgi:hypothetical protein
VTDTTDDDGTRPEQPPIIDRAHHAIAEYLARERPDMSRREGAAMDLAFRLKSDGLLAHDGRCFRLPEGIEAAAEGTEVTFRMADSGPFVRWGARPGHLTVSVPTVVTAGVEDAELTAMAALSEVLDALEPGRAARVVLWALDRWGDGGGAEIDHVVEVGRG